MNAKNYLKGIKNRISKYFSEEKYLPGHYYSVVPSMDEIRKREATIFSKDIDIHGIDLNLEGQVKLLGEFKKLFKPPYFYSPKKCKRFNIENTNFSYDDAPILHLMLRKLKPKRVVEIGSGNSSACMLDTSDQYLKSLVDFTFIDIDCSRLRENLLEKDKSSVTIIEKAVQDVDLEIYKKLNKNDLLFIDSSHVLKVGSDLKTIIFEILPILKPGVFIHFHDVRYPFEYSKKMIEQKIFWNEAYFLRAFLQNNSSYKVVFWLSYLLNSRLSKIGKLTAFLPLREWARRFNGGENDFSEAGGSIYIKKL